MPDESGARRRDLIYERSVLAALDFTPSFNPTQPSHQADSNRATGAAYASAVPPLEHRERRDAVLPRRYGVLRHDRVSLGLVLALALTGASTGTVAGLAFGVWATSELLLMGVIAHSAKRLHPRRRPTP